MVEGSGVFFLLLDRSFFLFRGGSDEEGRFPETEPESSLAAWAKGRAKTFVCEACSTLCGSESCFLRVRYGTHLLAVSAQTKRVDGMASWKRQSLIVCDRVTPSPGSAMSKQHWFLVESFLCCRRICYRICRGIQIGTMVSRCTVESAGVSVTSSACITR